MALKPGLLLDTHTWIWLRAGTLSAEAEVMQSIQEAASQENWFVCSFSFFEIAHAVQRKRLTLDLPLQDWLLRSSAQGMPRVLEITPAVAAATASLPSDFHGDPGDRLLVTTSKVYDLTICTHDKVLHRFAKQGAFRCLKVNEAKE